MPAQRPIDLLNAEHIALLPPHQRDRARQLLLRRAHLTGAVVPAAPWPDPTPMAMLRRIAPTFVTDELAPHHEQFWQHIMAIEPGVRPDPLVFVVNRGGAKSASAEMAAVCLGGTRRRKYVLYCSGTQEQADDHVASVADVLEGPQLAEVWPDMADRALGKFGNSRGWRRNRLRTKAGFTIDAIGLVDSARGARLEEQRPDLIILDDVDAAADSPLIVAKKLLAIRDAIIPAGSPDAATLFVQNVIHDNSICRRLVEPDEFPPEERLLLSRRLIGPIPAVWNLSYESVELPDGTNRWKILGGEPSWSRLPIERCEQILNDVGSRAFEVEYQHSTEPEPGGIFSHLKFKHMMWDDLPWGDFVDIQVWVDPAVTSKDSSDSCGVAAAAVDSRGFIYILWWVEKIMSPGDALSLAIQLAERLGASTVGVESDNGGDTWEIVFDHQKRRLTEAGELDEDWASMVSFAQDKAGSYGSKVERASQIVPDLEHGFVIHAINDGNTHQPMERALFRFPKTPPLDGVDAYGWAWRAMRRLVPPPELGGDYDKLGSKQSGWAQEGQGSDPIFTGGWNPEGGSRAEDTDDVMDWGINLGGTYEGWSSAP